MSTLGQTGSSHNHPGLTFPQVNGLRRGYTPSHSNTPPKASPSQSPYQTQQPHYASQQPQQGAYPHHLFSSTPSPVPNVASLQNVSNANSRHAPTQAAAHAAVQAARQHQHQQQQHQQQQQQHHHQQHQQQQQQQQQQHARGGQQRQMQSQPPPSMAFLQQAMNQPVSQQVAQVPQQVSQSIPSVQQAQPLSQTQSLQHQVQPNPQSQKVQTNDNDLISHTPPLAHNAHPQQHQHTHSQSHQQAHTQGQQQLHQQPPPPLPPQATPQTQHRSTPARSEASVPPHGSHVDDDMDIDSQADSGGEGDSHLEPKLVDGQPFVPRSPMGTVMSAPPEGGSFESLEAVHKYVLEYCTSVGYAVVIGRSKKTVPGLKKVLFVCDRAGKPPSRISPEQRKRKTSSRKCNCQFGFFAIEQRTQWTIRYRPDNTHLQHNHGPSESPLLHPAARKLDSKMVAAVKQLKESGIGVTQTLEILQQQNPHVPLLPRDIYNARAAINRNPQKVDVGIAEERPAIYSKPAPTAEERIRSDLRKELARAKDELEKVKKDSQKEVDDLKEQLKKKDKLIERFEMFIDICNERVMVQRERLNDSGEGGGQAGNVNG